jgi:hypothetical protein
MPSPADVQGDGLLTNISVAFEAQSSQFVGNKIFPIVEVEKEAGKFWTLDTARNKFRRAETLRAPRTPAKQVEWATGTDTYQAEEHLLESPVDDRERDNAEGLQPDIEAQEAATEGILLGREAEIAALATAAATYPAGNVLTLGGGDQWGDAAANPIEDVITIKEAIRGQIGRYPNTMVIPAAVVAKLQLHQKVIDRMGVNGLRVVTPDLLSALFEIPNVFVATAIENTAAEGLTAVLADLWGKHVVIAYVPPAPGRRTLALGYTFRKGGWKADSYRDNPRKSDVYRAGEIRVAKVVASGAGGVIRTAIA